jgi:hypothetical protein
MPLNTHDFWLPFLPSTKVTPIYLGHPSVESSGHNVRNIAIGMRLLKPNEILDVSIVAVCVNVGLEDASKRTKNILRDLANTI